MTTWVIISWVVVAILTGINVFVFLKLKTASEQMMKMAFPKAGNMGDAMQQAQKMMQGMNPQQMEAQMKAAMQMMSQMGGGAGAGKRPAGKGAPALGGRR